MLKNKIFIIIISFYIFWLGILPFALTMAVEPVCRNISHNSGCKISIKNPKIKFYITPNLKFKADEIYFTSSDGLINTNIEKFSIKIRFLPLLSGNFHINKVSASNFKLVSKIQKEIKLDKDFLEQIKTNRVLCDSVALDNFNAMLYINSAEPVNFAGKNFIIQNKNRYFKFKSDSTITAEGKTSKIYANLVLPKNNDITRTVFESEISNLDISSLGEFFRNFIPSDIVRLQGIINAQADKDVLSATFKDTVIIAKDEDLSIKFPKELKLNSKFNIKNDIIAISNLDVNSQNLHLSMEGKIKDYFGKTQPTVNLKIIVNKSKVEDFIDMLPPFRVEEFDTFKLKKYKFYGDTIGNMTIKGRLPEPEITGDVYIDNGILIKPIPNTNKGATIKLKFTGKYANYDIQVPAGFSEKVWVKGSQEIYNIKYGDLTVKSTPDIVLPVAEDVVNPLHEILNFIIGPVPILNVYDGTGNIDISVKGNRKNPHVWGVLNFKNASVNFKEIPDFKLTKADAVLTFNDKNAKFETKSGFVNEKDFKLSGVCDLNGKFDFNAFSQNQPIAELYKAIKTSVMLDDIQKMLPDLKNITGVSDLNLKIYGNVKNIEDLAINKNTFADGSILIKNSSAVMEGANIQNINGNINVNGNNAKANIAASIAGSPLNVDAKVKNDIGDISLVIPRLNPNFIIKNKELREKEYLPYISANAKYKGNINNIEYDKLNFNAKILEANPKSNIKFNSGEVSLNNDKAEIKKLSGYIKDANNNFYADLKIYNTFTRHPEVTGIYKLNLPNLTLLNEFIADNFVPESIRNTEFKKGGISINGRVVENKITTDLNLKDIEFDYIPFELPIKILNGKTAVRNNNMRLNKINLLADNMPILIDGEIKDIFNKNIFDIYINSKPRQEFIDKYLNKKIIYPVKIKGDIVYSTNLKGTADNYDLKAKIDMNKDSSIYHYGATVGDIENSIVLNLDSHITNNKNIYIRDFIYDKLIQSQNGRETKVNMLKAKGGVDLLKDDMAFRDFKIKTSMPTDARIFNIIFGKPNIKQGQFTSDLKMNGKLSNPHILGDFHIFETNIPFLDTTMKNIEFLFRDKTITVKSRGEVLGNEVSVDGILRNKLSAPYYVESASIYAKNMDLNRIVNKFKETEAETERAAASELSGNINIDSVIAKNINLKADKIELRNIKAENFKADTSLDENRIFDMKNFEFNIAQGSLKGQYGYNFKTNDIKINLNAESINANDITLALFDLNNQIYGDLTGSINMSCNGETFDKCMQTLNGNTIFNVKDGRMPKLGSLEYLLKAGNLVKGGLTGLSINSVIDIITPLKTGNFSDIFGSITIENGIANDIEITTKGKDLSLFIGGTYNFYSSQAEMEVLGLLSRKISTMFGPIGNMSINTLFSVIPGIDIAKDSVILDKINKIPGIEISGKAYRKFLAEIKGNINGDNYVTNFSWIN